MCRKSQLQFAKYVVIGYHTSHRDACVGSEGHTVLNFVTLVFALPTSAASRDGSNTDTYLFEPREAGSGMMVLPNGTLAAAPSVPPGAASGWNSTRTFEVEITDAPLVSGAVYYGLVQTTTCAGVQGVALSVAPVLYDGTPPVLEVPNAAIAINLSATPQWFSAEWIPIVDNESGLISTTLLFAVNNDVFLGPYDVSTRPDFRVHHSIAILDGSTVTVNVTAVNGAGLVTVLSAATVFDVSVAQCVNLTTVGDWASRQLAEYDPLSGTASISAQAECVDAHSGITTLEMSVRYVRVCGFEHLL